MPRRKRSDPAARIRRALLAVLEGDTGCALRELAACVRDDSDDAEAFLALAHLYRQRGEVGRAIRLHQNLLLQADLPSDLRFHALVGLASDLRAGGYGARAIAAYEEALDLDARRSDVRQALIDLLVEAGDFERAHAVLRRGAGLLRRASPRCEADLLVAQASAERSRGDLDAARRSLRRACKRDPQRGEAFWRLGAVEAERGRAKAALEAWQRALGLGADGGDPDALWARTLALSAQTKRGVDVEKLARACANDATLDEAHRAAAVRALATAVAARGEVDEALGVLRERLVGHPRELRTRLRLERLLLGEGREGEALKELGELVEVHDAAAGAGADRR